MNLDQVTLPLFVPASRMDLYAKAATTGADAIIVDLEDAVTHQDKDAARAALVEDLPRDQHVPTLVRINAADSPWFEADIAACRDLRLTALMLPKAENPDVCAALSDRTGLPVVGLVETALGLFHADAIAAACARLAFGSIDFAADLGLAHEQTPLLHARAVLVLAARLAGQAAPWDGVTVEVNDVDKILQDCRHSVAMGMGGKLLIHPAQLETARRGFAPTDTEREWATRVIAVTEGSTAAVKMDGQMVDAPVIARARAILARVAA
ncbi:CoA ester lyase [Pseudotabrizicola sp. 4114]|uniref:HpcH/HpaI aldolase/citrate lyase family protein n=1 Tax=Pseudotabrizicola sp. 4114 TaxID=2817731 RepID=UPI00286182B6|nr:citrate lyase subunit beta/citryl-CoA lyase [Pseudorhodobacter sp. 4114]